MFVDNTLSEASLDFLHEAYTPERGSFKNIVVLAVMLRFYEEAGRPPLNTDYIPSNIWEELSQQLNFPAPQNFKFDWEGRTAKRFRQKIRDFLGYRLVTHADKNLIQQWVLEKISLESKTLHQMKSLIYDYFKSQKIEPHSPKVLNRYIKSVYYQFELHLCKQISERLSKDMKRSLDDLIATNEKSGQDDDEENAEFKDLKHSPSGISKKHIHHEIKKLQTLKAIGLPQSLFVGVAA